MAQPIYFAPGYESPSRIRMEEAMLKAQAIQQGVEGLAGAVQGYLDNKTKAKYEKLGTMNAMLGTYGSEALGAHFQHEYGSLAHTIGIDFPQDETGSYKIPPTFEDNLRKHIMAHPELIPALIGSQKPDLSPGEVHYRDQEAQIKEEANNARFEAQRMLADAREAATQAKLTGIEDLIRGRHEDVATTVGGRSKDVATTVAGRSADVATTVEGRHEDAATRAAAAAATAAARPYAAPSGYYNYKGKLVPAAQVDSNPGRFEGAYPLNSGQYHTQLGDKKTRLMTTELATKSSLLELKLRADMENDNLKPLLMTISSAVKTKNTALANTLMTSLVTQVNQIDNLGLTEQEMASPEWGSFIENRIKPWFASLMPDATKPSSATGGPTADKPKGPAPARQVTLPSGKVIYEEEVPAQ